MSGNFAKWSSWEVWSRRCVVRRGTRGIGALDRDSPCREGTGDRQAVPSVRGFDILERFGDAGICFVGRCGGDTRGDGGAGGDVLVQPEGRVTSG